MPANVLVCDYVGYHHPVPTHSDNGGSSAVSQLQSLRMQQSTLTNIPPCVGTRCHRAPFSMLPIFGQTLVGLQLMQHMPPETIAAWQHYLNANGQQASGLIVLTITPSQGTQNAKVVLRVSWTDHKVGQVFGCRKDLIRRSSICA